MEKIKNKKKSLQNTVTDHQWSEVFFWAFFHADVPFLEWILQLLAETQQLNSATDKAAMYAFICKLVLQKKWKKEKSCLSSE